MVYYICNRCGYETKFKSSLVNHLNRKNICKPLLDDVSIEDIKNHYGLEIIENTTISDSKLQENKLENNQCVKKHSCEYCNKTFARRDGLTKHLKICKIKKQKIDELQQKKDEIQEKTDEMKEIIDEMKEIVSENKNKINKLENIIEDLSYDLRECINLNKKLRKENRNLNNKQQNENYKEEKKFILN